MCTFFFSQSSLYKLACSRLLPVQPRARGQATRGKGEKPTRQPKADPTPRASTPSGAGSKEKADEQSHDHEADPNFDIYKNWPKIDHTVPAPKGGGPEKAPK